jgi:hypothetical protein
LVDGIIRKVTPFPCRPHLNGWLQACAEAWAKRKNSTAPGRSHATDGPSTLSQEWMKPDSAIGRAVDAQESAAILTIDDNATGRAEDAVGLVFHLEPFSSKNQVDFIVKYWLQRNKIARENAESSAHNLKKLFEETTKDRERELTGYPLLIKMLAEAFVGETSLPKRLYLVQLYKMFWKKKFDIYWDVKCQ